MNGGQRNGTNAQIWESKTTRIMRATVQHVTSGLGLRKFRADRFLLDRVYIITERVSKGNRTFWEILK